MAKGQRSDGAGGWADDGGSGGGRSGVALKGQISVRTIDFQFGSDDKPGRDGNAFRPLVCK